MLHYLGEADLENCSAQRSCTCGLSDIFAIEERLNSEMFSLGHGKSLAQSVPKYSE